MNGLNFAKIFEKQSNGVWSSSTFPVFRVSDGLEGDRGLGRANLHESRDAT